jgi:hypothetical protein
LNYTVKLTTASQELVGRLKVQLKRPHLEWAASLENHYSEIEVSEILRECYSGEEFCGYENINHSFDFLESIFQAERPDWKSALELIKGIYLITDTNEEKQYVEATYGDVGVWSKWANYIKTGHGGNKGLRFLVENEGVDYAKRNLRFSLLEYRSIRTDDEVIFERETYWKETLLSRAHSGYDND